MSSSGSFCRPSLLQRGALFWLCDGFVALASKTRRSIDGMVNNGPNGVDGNIIKAVMFTEASLATQVLFLMWNESAHHGRDSISFC